MPPLGSGELSGSHARTGPRPSSLVIDQAEALAAQLFTGDTVLLLKIVNDVLLVAIHPTGCCYDQQLPRT